MAVDKFIPELWADSALRALQTKLVYGQPNLTNRNYEGQITQAGDTVHINTLSALTVAHDPDSVTYAALSDTQQDLLINQNDVIAFQVRDADAAQASVSLMDEATNEAGYRMAKSMDAVISAAMLAGATTVNVTDEANPSAADAYNNLVDLWQALTEADCPDDGRWAVVPASYYARLLKSDNFIRSDAAGTGDALRNANVGRAAGFDIFVSNTVPTSSGVDGHILAGHPGATTVAQQIGKVEALRLESAFADGIRMYNLYGVKVIRPTNLVEFAYTIA